MVSLLSSSLSSSHLSLSARATLPQLARYLADPFFIVPLLAYLLLCSIRCSHPASISLPFLGAPCLFRAPAVHSLHVHTLYYSLHSIHEPLSPRSSYVAEPLVWRAVAYLGFGEGYAATIFYIIRYNSHILLDNRLLIV